MVKFRVTYRMDPPGDAGDILFVVYKEITRYTQQDPYEWYLAGKSDWAGKKIISIEMVD